MTTIFVFGSNLAGRHGKGAALTARKQYGAEYGVGFGRTGNAYAIPTKSYKLQTLPLAHIRDYVIDFIQYTHDHPELTFYVTRIGCGLAGYSDEDIAPFFNNAPHNCQLPTAWQQILKHSKHPDTAQFFPEQRLGTLAGEGLRNPVESL